VLSSASLKSRLQGLEQGWTVAEIAKMLKLNPQTVRKVIDRGELAAV
jgi:DNA-binding NarL/FixJ family response regulator